MPKAFLIWIKKRSLDFEDDVKIVSIATDPQLSSRARPPLRHCPICGIAMQTRKSRDDSPHFDLFECLSCDTTIVEKPVRDGKKKPPM